MEKKERNIKSTNTVYDVIAKKISTVLHSVKVNYEIDLHRRS
jgi:hypothetical protein